MIPVTKPYLPNRNILNSYMDGIWERNWLTNNGPLVNELELKLKQYLGLKHLLFTSNGTIALQLAIRALGLKGEVITTPFSYVATTSSIVWEGCRPVFVDIDPKTYNLDPNRIEAAITSKTSAILATHVYGIACAIEPIQSIAKTHGLKVIFDAAHAFGSCYNGNSLFAYGDISTASFHATKLFHTVEGGAVITSDPDLLKRLLYMRNFGHSGPEQFSGIGINGKNSEIHAAVGLTVLPCMEEILSVRKQQWIYYYEKLTNLEVQWPETGNPDQYNYAYLPLVFKDEETCLRQFKQLEIQNIGTRRYFYPALDELDYVNKGDTAIARSIASRVLCLPLYHTLSKEEQDMVIRILLRTQRYG